MQLSEMLSKETLEKISTTIEKETTPTLSAVKKARLEKYKKSYFKTTDEMISYLKSGGTIVPVVGFDKERIIYDDNAFKRTYMIFSDSGTPIGYNIETYSEIDFKAKREFKVVDEGYIMFWKKQNIL